MKHKKALSYVGLGALAIAFYFGMNLEASAFFGGGEGGMQMTSQERATLQQNMFSEHAAMLGMSVDEVKSAWAKGTNILELAKAKGISEADLQAKFKASALAKIKAELNGLVSQGIITQAQADARFEFVKTRTDKMGDKAGQGKGKKIGHMMMRGLGGF